MADEKREGWTPFLLFICVEVTIGSVIPIGYSFGVLNAPIEIIMSWAHESAMSRYSKDLSDSDLMLLMTSIMSLFQFGGVIGSLFGSICNHKLGRRGSLLLSALLLTIAGLLMFLCRIANSIELLLLGRLICGFASALVYSTQPMYLVELAPSELSGSVGVFTAIGITLGIVLGQVFSFDYVLGSETLWHYALAGYLLFVLIGFAPFFFFPESPRYLMSMGKVDKTRKALSRLRSDPSRVDREMAEIEANSRANVEQVGMTGVICNPKLKMPLIIVCSFHMVQQMSGISAIWYYSIGIFTTAGFTMAVAVWLNFAEGSLNFIVALFGPLLMSKFNRRIMMLVSCLFSAIFLLLLSVSLGLTSTFPFLSFGSIAFLSLYIVVFNLGLASIPYFIGSEIFELTPRPVAMSLGSLCNWLFNLILALLFPFLISLIGPYAFILCSAFCVYGFCLTLRYLPETRNRETKDVVLLLENGFKSKHK